MKHIIVVLSAFYLLFNGSCVAQQPTAFMFPAKGKTVMILDADDAAKAITFDIRNGYFEKVTAVEMSIQMKQPLKPGQDRNSILPEYLRFMKTETADFSESELKFVSDVIDKMYQTVIQVNPQILPDTLKLIKTKGNHYGDGVWYTRENCIIIPANELVNPAPAPFTSTMFHELFHVYSRLNPDKRTALYRLIGFESIGYQNIVLPEGLGQRVLFNPDGVDFAQKITLAQEDGSKMDVIPVIYSKFQGYNPDQKEFFGYLEFNVFQIQKQSDGKWMVKTADDGINSPIKLDKQPDFFRQIKDNTGYIIHPDEVLADNFSYIMQELNGAKISQRFSADGKQLLKDIEGILTK